MECPICKEMMKKGLILCPHGSLKWVAESSKIFSKEGLRLPSTNGKLGRVETEAYYCSKCKKMIINDVY